MQKQHGRQKMEGGERERAREREREERKNSPDLKKFCRQKKRSSLSAGK